MCRLWFLRTRSAFGGGVIGGRDLIPETGEVKGTLGAPSRDEELDAGSQEVFVGKGCARACVCMSVSRGHETFRSRLRREPKQSCSGDLCEWDMEVRQQWGWHWNGDGNGKAT